jgi:NADH dehydrogenase
MYLVVGATGPVGLGGEICRLLRAEGKPVRVLLRPTADLERVAQLRNIGVEFVEGDLKNRASLRAACQGIHTVISSATTTVSRQSGDTIEAVDLAGQLQLADAAKTAGVERYLYTSFSGGIEGDFPLRNAKRGVEQHLKQSGLDYTILRPTYFMEVWLSPVVGFDYPNAQATIYGEGQQPISWIARDDVARFAMLCRDHSAARNATFELGGPEALSPLEVVRIFEEVGGRPFEVQHVTEQAIEMQQSAAQDSLQQSFASLMRCYAAGDPIDMCATLATFPMQLTPVWDYARRVLAR